MMSDNIQIPQKLRKFENLHIVFWIFKDMSWSMGWKTLGMFMILPTLSLAIYLTYKFRKDQTEWYHNLAVICWIFANSYWMISEFFSFDKTHVFREITGVQLSIIPFGFGILLLAYYYLILKRKYA